jgi:hypothetical protein
MRAIIRRTIKNRNSIIFFFNSHLLYLDLRYKKFGFSIRFKNQNETRETVNKGVLDKVREIKQNVNKMPKNFDASTPSSISFSILQQ